ncbi:hypothetical protein BDZ94DRAFT_1050903 [Collybia nuda]|uniref:Uncharacterized protein n=1 Tax=Collybia nuda TaxID=64659 RepID=A0A9P5Y0Z9_9AGAR|nr:hypothetical protein BDZ94DRAFT_1050903 [Collybia nuda]
MAPRPQSWVKSYDDVDFDISLGRRSSSPHERQHMLAESAMPTTRRPSGASGSSSPSPGPSSSSSSHTSTSNPRPSSTVPDARDQPPPPPPRESTSTSPSTSPEQGPSFLRMPRSASFASSPLNPAYPSLASPFARPGSRGSAHVTRIASEESRALSMHSPFSQNGSAGGGVRGSMILYRRADASDDVLLPPSMPHAKGNRASVFSTSGDSFMSLSSDSKYPTGMGLGDPAHPHPHVSKGGLVAYAYDPSLDDDADAPMDDEDLMHDPSAPEKDYGRTAGGKRSWRGFKNLAALGILIAALLCLFVVYPIIDNFRGDKRDRMILANTRINATGQAEAESFDPRKRGLDQVPI